MKKPKQLEFKKVNGWGGRRKGAGRKNKSGTVSHAKREEIDFKMPLHITLRLKKGLKNLRTPKMKKQFERCLVKAKEKGLNVLHFSIQSNHIHIASECADNKALASGMNSLGVSLGKAIRKAAGGKGSVFVGRYHVHVLKTPTQMRNALAYVLLNESNHRGGRQYRDEFSSGEHFKDWKKLIGRDWEMPAVEFPVHLSAPKSWLAREGWRRAS